MIKLAIEKRISKEVFPVPAHCRMAGGDSFFYQTAETLTVFLHHKTGMEKLWQKNPH
jgi:hypothetical protein